MLLNVVDLKDTKLELRAYAIPVPAQHAVVKVPGLRTDSEHKTVWGFFLHDSDYNGNAETLDTKSKISLAINNERVVEDSHACMFLANRGVSLADTAWKFKAEVNQSEISVQYTDSGKFAPEVYPRNITLYLVCEKRKP